jgi:hypothetical protein
MKIAFVWYFVHASEYIRKWRDGLRAAMEIIGNKHRVRWFLDREMPDPDDDFDFLLFWSSSREEYFKDLHNYDARKGICLTTDPHIPGNLHKMDVVFVESDPVYGKCRMHGLRTIKAFGTDTEYFKPNKSIKKDIEYFYPACFSNWKCQHRIAEELGSKLLCVGTIQDDGQDQYNICRAFGVQTEVGYFPVKKIKGYYDRAKHVIIPAIHGSERTVLEAMSMNILPEVTDRIRNKKAYSFIKEYNQAKKKKRSLTPREFVVKNYNHFQYAEALLGG